MKKIYMLLICVCTFIAEGCTEQYAFQSTNFESALVVEATITNELQPQKIKISRTYQLDHQAGPTFETGADVSISDDLGNVYIFEENDENYISATPFQAVAGRKYKLDIITSDGRPYYSTAETLTAVSSISAVTPALKTIYGVEGIQINVTSFDPAGSSKYYRYEYEETYKLTAPKFSTITAIRVPGEPHDHIEIVPKDDLETGRICYKTDLSYEILQVSTNAQAEDRVDFPVRFIAKENPVITNRYSILVKQYVQSLAAFTYYKTLKELSGSGNLLSPQQPGFLQGNLRSSADANEKVIGFFEVASVSSKRIFFNRSAFFPDSNPPAYPVGCNYHVLKFCFSTDPGLNLECDGPELLNHISQHTLAYISDNGVFYTMVHPACDNCTLIASSIIPSFWID